MNYLLLFENFYQPTTQDEFSERVFDITNCENFTDVEIEKIVPLLRDGILDRNTQEKKYRIDIRFLNTVSNNGKFRKIITVVKLVDEWYYIVNTNRNTNHDSLVTQYFYKCDQFDGLISFLKNNITT